MKRIPLYLSNNRPSLYLSALAIFLALVVLSPVINSGFEGDDAKNSLVGFQMSLNNQNAFEFTYPIYQGWLRDAGRFFPLPWVYVYSAHSILTNVRLYKASLIFFVLLNVLMFGYLIKLMTQSIPLTLLGYLLPPLFFQIRVSADPIRSFCWLQQLLFLYIIGSFILLILYLQKNKRYLYILSLFSYLLGLLTYEISYPFCLIHFFIVFYFSKKEKGPFAKFIKIALPFFLLSGACILVSILLRVHYNVSLSSGTNPYIPNYDIVAYLGTLAKEISAVFPLSYVILNPHGFTSEIFSYLKEHFSVDVIIVGLGYFFSFMIVLNYLVRDSLEPGNRVIRKPLLVLGFLLLILPAVLIALSPKYQAWSGWGIGYLNVYLSYFGLVMVAIFLFDLLYTRIGVTKRKVALPLSIILSTLMASVGVINYTTNSMAVAGGNSGCLYPRETIQNAIKRGLFRDVPEDAHLLVESDFVWDQLAFYWKLSGGKVKYFGAPGSYTKGINLPNSGPKENRLDRPIPRFEKHLKGVYYLTYLGRSRESGNAILGDVSSIFADNTKVYSAISKKLYIYVQIPYYSKTEFSLSGRWFEDKRMLEGSVPFMLHQDKWQLISSGKNWKLWALEFEDHYIDLKTLYIGGMLKKRGRSVFGTTNLKDKKDALLHKTIKYSMAGNDATFGPLTINDSFSIELILKPYEEQGINAHIVGNHPGYNGFEGFALQQDGTNQNRYTFGFGNGGGWLPGVRFRLPPEKWSYLSIVVEKNLVAVYIDGSFVATQDAGDVIRNSGMPLWVGNWVNKDRPFNGLITEVRILNRPLTETEIESSWRTVKENMEK
ncbi:MAG: LamG domain-containing protein [Deltaproteobacteria bacterium]|jgi:hypothetical protein|nr:LamG domain-containing protein [Deltaproteobacteria bacterium]